MKLHRQAHTVYKTQCHIVWVARFRRKVLTPGVTSYLKIKLHEVRQYYPDWYFTAIGVDRDHVPLHMEIPPRYSVSKVVDILKSNTSRALRAKFGFLDKVYWDRDGIWAKGFFVSTVGVNEDIIKRYVQMQGVEDAGQAELEL
jgi:putative transposase